MSNTIIVYSPDGTPEKHTRANARDLVNGAGYSWHPGVKTTPAGYAPFAAVRAPEGPVPSQKVLDSVGGSGSAAATATAGANAAALAEQDRIAAALAADTAAAAAAAAAKPPAEVVDYSQVTSDATDLDDAEGGEGEGDGDDEPAGDENPDQPAAPRRGRKPRNA